MEQQDNQEIKLQYLNPRKKKKNQTLVNSKQLKNRFRKYPRSL